MENEAKHLVNTNMTHQEYEKELAKYPDFQAAVRVAMGYAQAFRFVSGE